MKKISIILSMIPAGIVTLFPNNNIKALDSSQDLTLSVESTSSITESDVSSESITEDRDSLLKKLEALNLKDSFEEFKKSINNAWSTAELKVIFNSAESKSEENDSADKEKEEIEKKNKKEETLKQKQKEEIKSYNSETPANKIQETNYQANNSGNKIFEPNQAREAFEQITADLGVTGSEKEIWADVITRESGWNTYATNPSSGAYGLPQSLPGDKMASVGGDYLTNPYTQLTWMYNYVKSRYGSFAGINWYSRGWY